MRGEHLTTERNIRAFSGSSPHARGAQEFGYEGDWATRIIPACAGSTLIGRIVMDCIPDHPRMRGEHVRFLPAD